MYVCVVVVVVVVVLVVFVFYVCSLLLFLKKVTILPCCDFYLKVCHLAVKKWFTLKEDDVTNNWEQMMLEVTLNSSHVNMYSYWNLVEIEIK